MSEERTVGKSREEQRGETGRCQKKEKTETAERRAEESREENRRVDRSRELESRGD